MGRAGPPEGTRVDTVRLQTLARGFTGSAALFAAIDLGLFTAVAEGAGDVAGLATRLGISELNVERLATLCAAAGLLIRNGETFRNAPDVERFLVRGRRDYAGPWLTFARPAWAEWGKLTEHLRNPEPPSVIGMYADLTVEGARRYHEATWSIGEGAGRRFCRQVDLGRRRKLLDLGGGSGAYAIVAAQSHPELSAVVFDLPPVVAVTAEFIERGGVADRVSTLGGDFTRDPLPRDVDVVVMASNLPQYGREIIARVISRAFDALLPGGEMHLIGEMLDDDRSGPLDPAIWGLWEALYNSTGLAHSRADCIAYLEAAGFGDVTSHEFVRGTLTRVVGTKPD